MQGATVAAPGPQPGSAARERQPVFLWRLGCPHGRRWLGCWQSCWRQRGAATPTASSICLCRSSWRCSRHQVQRRQRCQLLPMLGQPHCRAPGQLTSRVGSSRDLSAAWSSFQPCRLPPLHLQRQAWAARPVMLLCQSSQRARLPQPLPPWWCCTATAGPAACCYRSQTPWLTYWSLLRGLQPRRSPAACRCCSARRHSSCRHQRGGCLSPSQAPPALPSLRNNSRRRASSSSSWVLTLASSSMCSSGCARRPRWVLTRRRPRPVPAAPPIQQTQTTREQRWQARLRSWMLPACHPACRRLRAPHSLA